MLCHVLPILPTNRTLGNIRFVQLNQYPQVSTDYIYVSTIKTQVFGFDHIKCKWRTLAHTREASREPCFLCRIIKHCMWAAVRFNITPIHICILISHTLVNPDYFHWRCARRELKITLTNFNSRQGESRGWKSTFDVQFSIRKYKLTILFTVVGDFATVRRR